MIGNLLDQKTPNPKGFGNNESNMLLLIVVIIAAVIIPVALFLILLGILLKFVLGE